MPDRLRRLLATAVVAVLAAACGPAVGPPAGDGGTTSAESATGAEQLAVVVASFDLAVGRDQRFLAGVFTPDRQVVGGGEVELQFTPPGEDHEDSGPGTGLTGRFLPVPGSDTPTDFPSPTVLGAPASHDHDPGEATKPHDHGDSDAAGVYTTRVDLDRPGIWEVAVTATVDGTTRSGSTVFGVADAHQVPTAGDPAPTVSTPTLDSDLPAAAIDSRARVEGAVPDEVLHTVDLADAIAAGRPAVVVLSTPTYCTSRFCGPITDTVEQLAHRYGDRAAFVHVEIWRDVGEQQMNDAVAPWIETDTGGNEPWVFLVGADGIISARWDNVLDEAELVAHLDQLPEG